MWLIRDFVGAAWGNRTLGLRTTRREQRVHRAVRRSAPCTSVRRNVCLTGWLGCRSGCRSEASQPRGLVSIDRDEAADGTQSPTVAAALPCRGLGKRSEEIVGYIPPDRLAVALALDGGPAEVEPYPDARDRVLRGSLREAGEVVDHRCGAVAPGDEGGAALSDREAVPSDDLPQNRGACAALDGVR